MKRKRFIKSFGFGIAGFFALGFEACKKIPKSIVNSVVIDSNTLSVPSKIVVDDSMVIDGYVNKLSFAPGESVSIYINSKIYNEAKIGIYDSNGNLQSTVTGSFSPQTVGPQAYMNGYQYKNPILFAIPEDFKSGLYFISKKIPFIVRNPKKSAMIVAVLSTNTDNAYNAAGGLSSYTVPTFSPILSFQRPYNLVYFSEKFWPWAETIGYDIDYITDADLDDYDNFSYAKVLIIPGHNEYWTRKGRVNFDQFIDSGRNALILSGNTMWWQVRYSNDGSQMICHKGLADPEKDPGLRTFNWHEKQLNYPIEKSIGMTFDLGGYGGGTDEGWDGFKIINQNSPLLKNTGLKNGDILSCWSSEYDGAPVKYVANNPHPVLDNKYNFHKIEMIGYDYGFRVVKTVATFIVLQRTATSGVIVNTASTNWCSKNGMGGKDGDKIKTITLNALNILLNGENAFTPLNV